MNRSTKTLRSIRFAKTLFCLVVIIMNSSLTAEPSMPNPVPENGRFSTEFPSGAHFRFEGELGRRVQANLENWLLTTPAANPGMIEMFRLRDRFRAPADQWCDGLVPWSGEFIGKFLISAIQARRMTDDPRLDPMIRGLISQFIATQAEDGYLGPFRKDERLKAYWDIWGHYHAIEALVMWHEDTGDTASLECAKRAADLLCKTYLDTGKKIADVGWPEVNLAIVHGLGMLYRHTGEPRYLRMMEHIRGEWEKTGDFLRAGLAGKAYYELSAPRWESLHDLQGLVEFYRITGQNDYRRAYRQHWTTIMDRDVHPSGGFSTAEQAIGNPYGLGAIETCCVVAWMAVSADLLRLDADPLVADALEMATWNAILGAQHPSGRWWTYNTPMDGVREAGTQSITFQARFGTPELSCCSANAPRGLGILSDWAVTLDKRGPLVNFYGPMTAKLKLEDGTPLTLKQETRYPSDATITLRLGLERPARFTLRLRVPQWSATTRIELAAGGQNFKDAGPARPGTYFELEREWRDGDAVRLTLDMTPHYWVGEMARKDKVALYAGPLLLAYDQRFNQFDPANFVALDLSTLKLEPAPAETGMDGACTRNPPLALLRGQARDGSPVTLCDFATAGAQGTNYMAWLPAINTQPAPNWRIQPRRDQAVAAGPVLFEWSAYGPPEKYNATFTLLVAKDADFKKIAVKVKNLHERTALVRQGLKPGRTYYWKVISTNQFGQAESTGRPWPFRLDPALPNTAEEQDRLVREALKGSGPQRTLIDIALNGKAEAKTGSIAYQGGIAPAADRFGREGGAVAFKGTPDSAIKFKLLAFPGRDVTFHCWVYPETLAAPGLQQVFASWTHYADDPLRVVIEKGAIQARIEAGTYYATPPFKLREREWVHVAAVKQGAKLTLYVNGKPSGTADVPEQTYSNTSLVALGYNPDPQFREGFIGRLSEAALYARAFSPEELHAIYERQAKPPAGK